MHERPGVLSAKIAGVEVSVSLLFPALVVLLTWYDPGQTARLCLLASLLHEGGHLLMLFFTGQKPESLSLGAFGMRIVLPPQTGISYQKQILVALAGPAVNLVAAFFLWTLGREHAAALHLALGAFNILPIRPLDGGQALLYTLRQWLSPDRADRIVAVTSVAATVPLTALSAALLWYSGYNLTMLVVCLYLILLLVFKNKD